MVSYNFQPAGTEYVDDVLILIVVEDGLVQGCRPIVASRAVAVLILIVVEDGLVLKGAHRVMRVNVS